MSVEISTIVSAAERLGEGAVWDCEDQKLWWVDITGGLINCYDPASGQNKEFSFGEPVDVSPDVMAGALWLRRNLVSGFFDPHTGHKTHILDPEADIPEKRV